MRAFIFIPFLFLATWAQTNERVEPMKRCTELYKKKNELIDNREYGDKCSFVCIVNGIGNKSTSFQQPNGVPCHEEIPTAKQYNWMCFKGQCVTQEAVNACEKLLGSEENISSIVYQKCNVVCLGTGRPDFYDHFFNSSESCYSNRKSNLGFCSANKSCVSP